MTESIKNVGITKQEPVTPPNTPEKSPAKKIKERLNLHVKRRLQHETPTQEQQQHQELDGTSPSRCFENKNLESMLSKHSDSEVKTRKCYEKRSEKVSHDGTAVRKYKRRKTKHQIVGTAVGNKVDDVNCTVIGAVAEQLPSCSASVGSGNGDGDGDGDGHDGETKCATTLREKDRCSDVLGMVLSAKKKALMQHPDVQTFLEQVMAAIKS